MSEPGEQVSVTDKNYLVRFRGFESDTPVAGADTVDQAVTLAAAIWQRSSYDVEVYERTTGDVLALIQRSG